MVEAVMHQEASVEIDRPIEEVFRLTTEHVPDWSDVVVAEEMLDEKPAGVGTTFRTITQDHGKQMVFQGVVTKYDPPRASTVRLTGDMFDIEAEYTFEDLAGRTRVTQRSTVSGKGFTKVVFALFGWMMRKSSCKALEKELAGLKRFCEDAER